jgi:hypothetical protein
MKKLDVRKDCQPLAALNPEEQLEQLQHLIDN